MEILQLNQTLSIIQPGSDRKPPIEEGRFLQATQSLPVWMPSTVSTTTAPEGIEEEVTAIKIPPLTPRAIEESIQSNHSIHDPETPETPVTPVNGKYFPV